MHMIGYVFVDKPTKGAVEESMDPYQDSEWDWYRCGGRWDGLLLGEEEMKNRKTHDGFNFDDANDNALRNSCLVKNMPADLSKPHFFISDGEFIESTHYDKYAKSTYSDGYGAMVESLDYEKRYTQALKDNHDKYLVVIDAHI